MSDNFDRSQFQKSRHTRAKQQKQKFEGLYPGEDVKYSDFLKKETPLERNIITYEVSYQLSYRGEVDHLIIAPKTFLVVGFKGQESEIQNRTMNMVLDSRGRNTKANFQPNTLNAMENTLNIKIMPRGMEESQRRPTKAEVQRVTERNFVVRELDSNIKFKNKKGREGNIDLDIRHFL